MIDQDTAIQWAKDAGFVSSIISLGYDLATPSSIQALITRAQNEAFEQAAKMLDIKADDYAKEFGFDDMGGLEFSREAQREYHSILIELAEEIRALKQGVSK